MQFNKDLRMYFQKLRMEKMKETKDGSKKGKTKTNYHFYKGTMSIVQS